MATQGERRKQAIQAVRALRRHYRAADTAGELVERELDRLVKRKTLVQPESLQKTGNNIDAYVMKVNTLVDAFVYAVEVLRAIPV